MVLPNEHRRNKTDKRPLPRAASFMVPPPPRRTPTHQTRVHILNPQTPYHPLKICFFFHSRRITSACQILALFIRQAAKRQQNATPPPPAHDICHIFILINNPYRHRRKCTAHTKAPSPRKRHFYYKFRRFVCRQAGVHFFLRVYAMRAAAAAPGAIYFSQRIICRDGKIINAVLIVARPRK